MKSSGIGGQAVLEGVMMRNKSDYAVAVRKPDGEIAVTRGKCRSLAERSLFFRLPIVRGVVAFFESLVLGMRTLTYSASFYEEEEEKKQEKKEKDAPDSKKDWKEDVQMGVTIAFSIALAVLVFVALPYFMSQLLIEKISSYAALAVIEGLFRIALFIGYVVAISFMNDIRRTFMYHGAEHKTINCIENGLELTVENVRRQSKHHRRCGTSFLFIVVFLSIIFFMFIHFDNMWLRMLSRIILVPVIAGVSYEFIHFAGNSDSKVVEVLSKPGMLLQMLTTREPDNKMIEVAIASVEEVFDWREYQKRCIAAKKSMAKLQKNKQEAAGKRKSRAELAEEIKRREEENAKRANDRARRLMEQERKEAELEKLASEAAKRKTKRQATMVQSVEDEDEGALEGLDHYFDDGKKEENK
ncbi:MAG: DUF1385 domain-containing protein [Lachnospiraceae bacterium]|nr:DUF1385 domain-containing protein [Lachnospiraceae bacterium]